MNSSEELVQEKYREVISEKLNKNCTINDEGCWIWNGAKHFNGYGKIILFKNGKRFHRALHRLSWIVFKGDIPKGMIICHSCDVGSCCNPDHLFIGTPKDNTNDMIKKGRMADFSGENNSSCVLTEDKVKKMRSLKKNGMKTCEIAREFDIKYTTCLDVVNYRNWKKVG